MPEFSGWLDNANDRFFDGGFVWQPPSVNCRFCDARFASLKDLNTHHAREHPISKPTLKVDDIEVADRGEAIVLTPKQQIELSSWTSVAVESTSGEARQFESRTEFSQWLSGREYELVVVRAKNTVHEGASAEAEFKLYFVIASDLALEAVEQDFGEAFVGAEGDAPRGHVWWESRFTRDTAVSRYADALERFAGGIKKKNEGSSEYREAFQRSLHSIAIHTGRSFPRTISTTIRLNLSDYRSDLHGATLLPELDRAVSYLHDIHDADNVTIVRGLESRTDDGYAIPLDEATRGILAIVRASDWTGAQAAHAEVVPQCFFPDDALRANALLVVRASEFGMMGEIRSLTTELRRTGMVPRGLEGMLESDG